MYISFVIKYLLFLLGFNETWIFSTDFRKKKNTQNIIFNKNPSSRSRIVPCGRTVGQTHTTKRIVAFHTILRTRLKLVDCAAVREDGNTKSETIIILAKIGTICVDVATDRYDPTSWPDFLGYVTVDMFIDRGPLQGLDGH